MYEFTITVTHMDVAITLATCLVVGTVTLAIALLSVLHSEHDVTPEDIEQLKRKSFKIIDSGKTYKDLLRHRMKERWPDD